MKKEIKPNSIDKIVSYFSPEKGVKRYRSRMALAAANAYVGASRSLRSFSGYNPGMVSPDDALKYDRQTMLDRHHELDRNHPIVSGILNDNCMNIVGAGLSFQSRIDADFLGLTDEQAEALETNIEREWRLFSESPDCDLARINNFADMQELALRQVFACEAFGVLSFKERPGNPYALKIQLVEPERVCNESNKADGNLEGGNRLYEGIETDKDGAPVRYHICSDFPTRSNRTTLTWTKIPAFAANTGLRNVLHVYKQRRPGQSRGVPYLSAVVEPLHSLGKYSKAELDAAVISSFFSVFLRSELPETALERYAEQKITSGAAANGSTTDIKLAPGAIIGLDPTDRIEFANPTRPNGNYSPFVEEIMGQIGMALGVPKEVMRKYYSSSYSAAYASINDAWRFYKTYRTWFVRSFCQPIFNTFMYEAVARGRISAPGFFDDPLIRAAYCAGEWVGPTKSHLNPVDEANAIKIRTETGVTTLAHETAEFNGGQIERNMRQIKKETAMKKDAGLTIEQKPVEPTQKPAQGEKNVPD